MKQKIIVALALFLLVGCGGGGNSGGSTEGKVVSAVIGAAGGEVTSVDGKMKLTIPAGALGSTQTISIEKIDPATLPPNLASSPLAYEMKPDGLTFSQPVSASVVAPDPPIQKDGSLKAPLGSLLTLSGSQSTIEALANQEIVVDSDTNSTTFSATLTHFSTLVFVLQSIPESQGILDKLLTELSGVSLLPPADISLFPLPTIMEVGKEEKAILSFSSYGAFTGIFRY